MPGTPDPVLGSDALSLAVACFVGALVAAVPYGFRESLPRPGVLAVGGGLAYAVVCLAAWALARIATIGVPFQASEQSGLIAVLLALNVLVIGSQVAIPYYLYASYRFVSPLAGAFVATVFVLTVFLGVGGETDPIVLYPVLFGPILVVGIALLAFAEFCIRRFLLAG
jgi:hypothetical protein